MVEINCSISDHLKTEIHNTTFLNKKWTKELLLIVYARVYPYRDGVFLELQHHLTFGHSNFSFPIFYHLSWMTQIICSLYSLLPIFAVEHRVEHSPHCFDRLRDYFPDYLLGFPVIQNFREQPPGLHALHLRLLISLWVAGYLDLVIFHVSLTPLAGHVANDLLSPMVLRCDSHVGHYPHDCCRRAHAHPKLGLSLLCPHYDHCFSGNPLPFLFYYLYRVL
mmetsp:Transcript_8535/g.12375  ORF Transcript_8535/g.12375 Transcript_8535/m.12375 type:complete len:221 (+) Transcript_8535:695-1357(+)